ncbi:unnamed protein product [Bemisia tabaci]|uniref:Uncharacterized protein n=2 Tax=Bemisia tabaci TaxID=7038 RepID=A0A9P0AJV0_BEMTA|nr:unnamed protein product [Bemisia tabaci]
MFFSTVKCFIISFLVLCFCNCISANYGYVKFNETCVHSDNCVDYKMVCAKAENEEMRCLCSDMLYIWSEQLEQCIMDSDKLKKWLFRVQADISESGEASHKESNSAFVALTLCGVLIVLSLLSFLGFVCVLFGCRIDTTPK